MTNLISKKTINADDLAIQLGMSRNATYNAIKDGKIPGAVRVGRRWLIPADAADRLLSSSQTYQPQMG